MPQAEEWSALVNVDQLGPVTFQKLLGRFGSPADILRAQRSELQTAGISERVIDGILAPNETAIARDMEWLQHDLHHLVTIQDASYPQLLRQISNPPMVLYAHGEAQLLTRLLSDPQLAIIGSRNASANGTEMATVFARKLAQAGLVITSGLASGIDGAAHRGALQAELGKTIAVAACGLDRVYPAKHRELAEQIVQRGVIISEFPIGRLPKPGHFPRRNRIISGLSLGVLVVEASVKSGSLTSARMAGEQGREVFAVPGSIHNPLAKGCHMLIRNGAKLVETVGDILEEFKNHIDADEALTTVDAIDVNAVTGEPADDPEHEKILHSMGYEPISIDNLVERCGLRVDVVSSSLLIMELSGQVSHNGNGVYVRAYKA